MTDKKYKLNDKSVFDDDEDEIVAGEEHPFVPEGEYQVCCISVEKGRYKDSPKIYLKFKIVTGEHMDTELFMAMNYYKKTPRGSKYYKQWVIANKNILPSRGERMSSKVFKDGVFEAVVKTVKTKFDDGTEQPDCFRYSKVDYLKMRLG